MFWGIFLESLALIIVILVVGSLASMLLRMAFDKEK